MKKILTMISAIIVIYAIYVDLTEGTLHVEGKKPINSSELVETIPYKKIEVRPGDTVLSIVEQLNGKAHSLSIEKIVKDFERLNAGLKPEEIQAGKIYNFPIYEYPSE